MTLSKPMQKVLKRAASREAGNVCPIVDVRVFAAAEASLLRALWARGFINNFNGIPIITKAGRDAVAQQQ